jgi:ATP synthase protein I
LTKPGQYGPRGLRAAELPRYLRTLIAGVESMADDARGKDDRKQPTADEAALSERLRRLGERLEHSTASTPPDTSAPRPTTDASGLARGLRLSTELVAGVVVGGLIGWFLDRWLGISPWGFIVFVLLGFTAGMLNLMRSAGFMSERDSKN